MRENGGFVPLEAKTNSREKKTKKRSNAKGRGWVGQERGVYHRITL